MFGVSYVRSSPHERGTHAYFALRHICKTAICNVLLVSFSFSFLFISKESKAKKNEITNATGAKVQSPKQDIDENKDEDHAVTAAPQFSSVLRLCFKKADADG